MWVFFLTPLLSEVNRHSLKANLAWEENTAVRVCAYQCVLPHACVWVFACTYVCICGCYLTFRADDSLQTSHGVGGPVNGCCHGSECWKQQISFQYHLQIVGTSTWLSISLCFSLVCVSLSICTAASLHLMSLAHAFCFSEEISCFC